MATVCGGCLALMDAGVPISDPVAGISIGLVTQVDEQDNITEHVLLTDIIGAEDHYGDMDFKVCGTKNGITGFQLDLKIKGLPLSIAKEAIYRNKSAREKIMEVMLRAQPGPNQQLKPTAPQIVNVQIDPEKIGALIGPGGKNIKRITEETGAQIDIHEDNSGRVLIFAKNKESMDRALYEVRLISAEIEIGKTYKGIVKSIKEFGIFVECLPGKEGMVHVSELADFRVDDVSEFCHVGDEIIVKCVGYDDKGRIRLSRRAVICEAKGEEYTPTSPRSSSNNKRRDRK